jgi:predicted MFS family arabinose efflux permease
MSDHTDARFGKGALPIIAAGAAIVFLAMGIRQSFGLFLAPVTDALGSGRSTFSLAMAVQNIMLGLPLAGILADRFGSRRVAALGGVAYATAMLVVARWASTSGLFVGLGITAGLALSATSYVVVLGAVGRVVPSHRRASAFGIITAFGSLGMFAMIPVSQGLLGAFGWHGAFVGLAAITGLITLIAARLPGSVTERGMDPAAHEPLAGILARAIRNRSYLLLIAGFFVCGFHVAFISTHLPAYLSDGGISTGAVTASLALIGLMNIVGSSTFGLLGDRYRKRTLLSILYFSRAVLFVFFLMVPLTNVTAIVFGAVMGFLWLGTVPLTSGTVATLFGVRYLATLYGVVFLSHQVGAFLGVWLGGAVYDRTGSYASVWMIAVVLGVISALIHIPIDDRKPATVVRPRES